MKSFKTLATLCTVFAITEEIQAEFDAIRECSLQFSCSDDFVPEQCLPHKARFAYRSNRCVRKKSDQCKLGQACARRSLKLKFSDFRQILSEFGFAPLANKSNEKKRHEFFHPSIEKDIDLGICLGSCMHHKR